MQQLRNVLEEAQSNGVAVGHFNISDWILLKAVFAAAQELKVPVIVGASEGERAFLGVPQIAALVRSLREEEGIPIFLNADHTHSLESAMAAAKAGFDSIVYDLSALPFEENVKQTRQAVEALKSVNPAILVEGEIGNIGTGSEIHESAPDNSKDLSTPEEAKQFVESTGVDILAPAVGNTHGMLQTMVQGSVRKRLDLARIREIKRASRISIDPARRLRYGRPRPRGSDRGRNQYHSHQHRAAALHGGAVWKPPLQKIHERLFPISSCPSRKNRSRRSFWPDCGYSINRKDIRAQ